MCERNINGVPSATGLSENLACDYRVALLHEGLLYVLEMRVSKPELLTLYLDDDSVAKTIFMVLVIFECTSHEGDSTVKQSDDIGSYWSL